MSDHPPRVPADWHEAFAILPLEAPPADGWRRIASRLDAERARRPAWPWALAAAIACLAIVPAVTLLRGPVGADDAAGGDITAGMRVDLPAGTLAAGPRADGPIAPPESTTATAAVRAAPADVHPTPADAAGHHDASLERMYAESARLESLLGRVQGPRATNAGMETATQQVAGAIGAIDAALADATLDTRGRQALWQERNALLEQMLTLELQHDLLSRQAATPFDFAQVN
ncbi:hypothetical protein [Pseudoxanthomonas sp. 10H]|uniref:hypothetical protein n=1 Tax=Pseudoxanthomonas sp. 10H TaxID=3242729 RepID=UPI003556C56A